VFQPSFDDQRYSGINPYALGFAMMKDIRRICIKPTKEDELWFPQIAGCGDWRTTLRDAWANHRDESFIKQFLSPRLIRKLRLFALADEEEDSHYTVTSIHDERGYRKVRKALARSFDLGAIEPNIQVVDVDLLGDRHLRLQHTMSDNIRLAGTSSEQTLAHVRRLWGYNVSLRGVDGETDTTVYEISTEKAAA
jgi:spore cortex formation protein SpoVR/YcgB (stage V sporulation)